MNWDKLEILAFAFLSGMMFLMGLKMLVGKTAEGSIGEGLLIIFLSGVLLFVTYAKLTTPPQIPTSGDEADTSDSTS